MIYIDEDVVRFNIVDSEKHVVMMDSSVPLDPEAPMLGRGESMLERIRSFFSRKKAGKEDE